MVDVSEWNIYKLIWLLNAVFVFFLIAILWLNPVHTASAEAYGWLFLGFILFFIIDLLILDTLPLGHVFKTITANTPSDKDETRHPLQWVAPVSAIMVGSVLLGLVWGGVYAYEVTFFKKVFISVPNLFSAQPFGSPFSAEVFDLIESSIMVATVEESIWSGMLFPILWGLTFIGIIYVLPEQKTALIISLVIAALLTGWLVANPFHQFVYGANAYATANAQQHFTLSALVSGATGTTTAPIIAHAIHNFFAKQQRISGSFTVLPLSAFVAIQQDTNRTFQTFPEG